MCIITLVLDPPTKSLIMFLHNHAMFDNLTNCVNALLDVFFDPLNMYILKGSIFSNLQTFCTINFALATD